MELRTLATFFFLLAICSLDSSGQNIDHSGQYVLDTPGSAAVAPSIIPLYDSIYHWHWDANNSDWDDQAFRRVINFTYDAAYNKTSQTTQNHDGSGWENIQRTTYTYDAFHHPTEVLVETWSSGDWYNLSRTLTTYDMDGNLLEEHEQSWNFFSDVWDHEYKRIYTYDENGNQLTHLSQSANNFGILVNTGLTTYTYDDHNNLTSNLRQIYIGSTPTNYFKLSYTYNTDNQQTTYLQQGWDNSAWENEYQGKFGYEDNLRSYWITEQWNGGSWDTTGRSLYTYDENDFLVEDLRQDWDGIEWGILNRDTYTNNEYGFNIHRLEEIWTGTEWLEASQWTYAYDSNDNQTLNRYESWNGLDWEEVVQRTFHFDPNSILENETGRFAINPPAYDSTHYYFTAVTSVEETQGTHSISIFPNPSNGIFQLDGSGFEGDAQFIVFDISGAAIRSGSLRSDGLTTVDMKDADPGVYLLKVEGSSEIFSSTIVLSK